MGSSCGWASIEIPKKYLTPDIIALIDQEQMESEEDSLDGKVTCFSHGEATAGYFEKLENILGLLAIPFSRTTAKDWEWNESIAHFRNDSDKRFQELNMIDGSLFMKIDHVHSAIALLKLGDLNSALALLEAQAGLSDPPITPLSDCVSYGFMTIEYVITLDFNDPEPIVSDYTSNGEEIGLVTVTKQAPLERLVKIVVIPGNETFFRKLIIDGSISKGARVTNYGAIS